MNLGGYTINTNGKSFVGDGTSDNNKGNAYQKIGEIFTLAGGATDSTNDGRWWTITESTTTDQIKAYTLTFKSQGKNTGLLERQKSEAKAAVRPVLSF